MILTINWTLASGNNCESLLSCTWWQRVPFLIHSSSLQNREGMGEGLSDEVGRGYDYHISGGDFLVANANLQFTVMLIRNVSHVLLFELFLVFIAFFKIECKEP